MKIDHNVEGDNDDKDNIDDNDEDDDDYCRFSSNKKEDTK